MTKLDEKHHLQGEQVIKTSDGIPIDLDVEPVILFRGRDRLALSMLEHYRQLCIEDGCTEYQMATLNARIDKFQQFAVTSDAMKQPGSSGGRNASSS